MSSQPTTAPGTDGSPAENRPSPFRSTYTVPSMLMAACATLGSASATSRSFLCIRRHPSRRRIEDEEATAFVQTPERCQDCAQGMADGMDEARVAGLEAQ